MRMFMNFFSRNPYLLYSYLATEMLAPFFASFLVMNGVFFLVKLIPFLNFSLDLGIGFADFVRLLSYMLPSMLLYTIPMASMMGIIICFSRLSNDTEILALKASGVSIYRLLPPVIAVSCVIAIATSYISVKLIPQSDKSMKQLTYQLLKEKVDKGIKEHQFTEALGDLVIYVDEIDYETGEWKKVWVSDMRGQTNPTITLSSTGRMISDMKEMNVTILLRNGSLHRPDGINAQIINFEKYVINIPLQFPARIQSKKRNTLSLSELLLASKELGIGSGQGRDMLVEYHKRLVLPVGCLVLSLLGLPLGLLAGPGKKAVGIPLGLSVFILYYVIFTAVKTLAEDGVGPVFLLMWLPNALFSIAALYSVNRVSQELPLLSEESQEHLKRLHRSIIQPLYSPLLRLFSVVTLLTRRFSSTNTIDSSFTDFPEKIIADNEGKVFHLPECEHYNSRPICTVEFSNIDQAIKAGFLPCDYCRSLLKKHGLDQNAHNTDAQ